MNRRISIIGCLLFFTLFSGCRKETVDLKSDYNQKANEVIQQLIVDDTCSCLSVIPNDSKIQISLLDNENVVAWIREKAIKELHLKNRNELDSLEKLASRFVLDPSFLKRTNIEVVKQKSLRELTKNDCQKGILVVAKPIFNKDFTAAIISYGHYYTCNFVQPKIYKYKNGKWTAR